MDGWGLINASHESSDRENPENTPPLFLDMPIPLRASCRPLHTSRSSCHVPHIPLLISRRPHRLALFGTGRDRFVHVFDLQTRKDMVASHETALAVRATAISSSILITGGTDGSVRIWSPPGVTLPSVAMRPSAPVVAVSACYNNGLIASLDRANNLILQILGHNHIMRSIKLDFDELELRSSGSIKADISS
jgi:WD40 repeat protein